MPVSQSRLERVAVNFRLTWSSWPAGTRAWGRVSIDRAVVSTSVIPGRSLCTLAMSRRPVPDSAHGRCTDPHSTDPHSTDPPRASPSVRHCAALPAYTVGQTRRFPIRSRRCCCQTLVASGLADSAIARWKASAGPTGSAQHPHPHARGIRSHHFGCRWSRTTAGTPGAERGAARRNRLGRDRGV